MASQRHEEELRMKREQKRLEKLRSVKSTVDMGGKARPSKNPNRREPKVQLPDMNLFNVDYGNDRTEGLQRRPRISPAKAASDDFQGAPLGPTLRARHDVKPASRGANGYEHEGDENDDNFNAYQGPSNKSGVSALDIFEEMTPGIGMVPSVMASRSPKPREANFANAVGGGGGGNERSRHCRHPGREEEQQIQSHIRKKDHARPQPHQQQQQFQRQQQYLEADGDYDDDDDESEVAALAEAMELNRRLRAAMQGNSGPSEVAAAGQPMEPPTNKLSNKGRTREEKVPRAGYRGMRQLQEEKQQLATMSQRSESAPALGASQPAASAAQPQQQPHRSSAYGAPADPRAAARVEKKRRHHTGAVKPPSDAWQDGPDRSPMRGGGGGDGRDDGGSGEDRTAMVEYGPPVKPSGRERKDSRAAAAEPLQQEAVAAAQAAARRAGEYREKQRSKQLPSSPRGKDRAKLIGAKVSPINPDPRSGGGPNRKGADSRGLGQGGEDGESSENAATAAAKSNQGGPSGGGGTKARAAAAAAADTKAGGATVLKDGKGVGALREELDEAVKLLADLEANPLGTSSYTPRESTSRGNSGHGNRRRPRQGPGTTKTGAVNAGTASGAISGAGGGSATLPSEISGALNESALAAAAENLRLRASLAKVATVKKLSPAKAVALSAGKVRPLSSGITGEGALEGTALGADGGGDNEDAPVSSRAYLPSTDVQQQSRREAFNAWCRQNAAAATALSPGAVATKKEETLPISSSPILLPAERATRPLSSNSRQRQHESPVVASDSPKVSNGSPAVNTSPRVPEPPAVPKSPHAVSISPVVVSESPAAVPKSPVHSHRSPAAGVKSSPAVISGSPAAVLNLAVASESAMPSHEPYAPPSTQKSAAGLFSDSQLSDLLQYQQSDVAKANSPQRTITEEGNVFSMKSSPLVGSPLRGNSPSKRTKSASRRGSPNRGHHEVPSFDEAATSPKEAVVPAPSSSRSLMESPRSKSEALFAAMRARVKASDNGEEGDKDGDDGDAATGASNAANTEIKKVDDYKLEGIDCGKQNAQDDDDDGDDSDENHEGIEPKAEWTKESDHAVMHDISPAGWGWCQDSEAQGHEGNESDDNDNEDVDSNAAVAAPMAAAPSMSQRGTGELESDEEAEGYALDDDSNKVSDNIVPASLQRKAQPPHASVQQQRQQQKNSAPHHVPPPADTRVRVEKGELRLKRQEVREVD